MFRGLLLPCLAAAALCLGAAGASEEIPPIPLGGLPELQPGEYFPEPLFLNQDRVLRDYSPNSGTGTLLPSPTPVPNPWWTPAPAQPGRATNIVPPFKVSYNGQDVKVTAMPLLKDGAFFVSAADVASMLGLIMQRKSGGVRYFVDGYYLGLTPGDKELWYQSILDPSQEGVVFLRHAPVVKDGRLLVALGDIAPYLGLKLSYDKSRRHLAITVDQVISTFSPGPRFQGVFGY